MTTEDTEQNAPARAGGAGRFHPHDRGRRPRRREARRAGGDALSARAERLPAHRPRQVDLPELRHRRGDRRDLQPPLRRHEPHQGGRRVRGRHPRGRRVARVQVGRAALRVRLLRAALPVRRRADPAGTGVRGQPERRRDSRLSGDAHRARPQQPVSRSADRGEPRPVCADAGRRVRGRDARAARQDRHGVAELQHARPDALPDPARVSSPDRRRVVHLPDVRLRAPAVGRDRAHHALALHARIRGSSPALRLARVQPQRRVRRRAAAADRVREAESQLHGDEQAEAPAARAARPRVGLGRSADADHQRPQAARVHAGIDPRFLHAHRHRQERKRHRHGAARALHPRGSQSPCAARHGGVAPAQGGHHELPGGAGRGRRRHQQPRGSVGRHAEGAVLARALHRAGRLQGRSAEEVLPAVARQGSAAALRLLHHVHRSREETRRERLSSCAARTIRRRAAATRRTAGRSRPRSTGCRRPTPARPRSGSTIACSWRRIPSGTCPGTRSSTTSTRSRSKCSATA